METDGIWDDFQLMIEHRRESHTIEKPFLFVNMAVFLWSLVCGSCIAIRLDAKRGLETMFNGGAGRTFRLIVEALGFNEETYPYYAEKEGEGEDEKVKVLRVWKGWGK